MKRTRLTVSVSLICLLAAALGFALGGAGNAKSAPTFNKDVAPIFAKNCMSCHRPGEIAPMSLLTYKEVRPWAKAIREKVAKREMPPWHADPQHGAWANDRRMSQKEIDTILAWVDGGVAEGAAKDLPPLPRFATGWQIGEPDVIFQMPTEYTVPATGAVPYQYFTVPTEFKEDRYVTAMEARAGALAVVHHIVVYVREPGTGARPTRRQDIGTGLLGALSPGMTPFIAQAGTAKLIKAGSSLVLQMHYTPSGKEMKDRSLVGLKFAKTAVEKVITTTAAWDPNFRIPPGAANHEVKAYFEAEQDIQIISFMPHMHVRGKDYVYRALYPDGRSEVLLSVPRYDFNWQVYYYPKQPVRLPKGTKIEAIAHYDNSTRNALNPDPTKEVRFGEQTWEEMMNGFFDYIVAAPGVTKGAASSSGNR